MKTFKTYLAEAEAKLESIQRYGAVGSSSAIGHSLAETGMPDVDMAIHDIIDGEVDPYMIMNHPTTPEEEYVSKILKQDYDTVAQEYGLHADDDADEILRIVIDNWATKYQRPELEEDQSAGVLAAKELETDITNPMPGVHESKTVDNELYTIVRFAGLPDNKGK